MNTLKEAVHNVCSYIFHKLWFLVLLAPIALHDVIWLLNGRSNYGWKDVAIAILIIACVYILTYSWEIKDLKWQWAYWRESHDFLADQINDPKISRIIRRKEYLKSLPKSMPLNEAGMKGLIKYLKQTKPNSRLIKDSEVR